MNKKAIIYARVSSARQADEGLPIESQIDQAQKKADSLAAEVMRTFVDAGISGRTDDRPSFQDAILYCKAFSIDYFICWSTSRFARNKVDASLYKRDLEKSGTRVVYVSVDLDNTTDAGWMMESMLEIFDEHYSRQISTDTRRSMIKNAHDGGFNGGRPPFGYLVIPWGKRKKLAIDPQEAEIVRHIFKRYLAGYGTQSIASDLNQKKITTRQGSWNKGTITNILKNEVYLGRVIFGRKKNRVERPRSEWIIVESHEAIIKEDDFMQVQDIFSQRTQEYAPSTSSATHLFAGMMICAKCGSAMQIETATGRSKTYSYYNCRAFLKGNHCQARRIPCQQFDDYLLNEILSKVITKESMIEIISGIRTLSATWVKERKERREMLVTKLRETETRLKNLYEILELHGQSAPNLSDLAPRIRTLKTERDDIEAELLNLEGIQTDSIEIDDNQLQEAADLFRETMVQSADKTKTRTVLASFIDQIQISDSSVKIKYNPHKLMNRAMGAVHSDDIWLPDHPKIRTENVLIFLDERFIRKTA